MSWLTKIAMKKRWLTFLIIAIITGSSIWSMLSLQMELIPDIELPITSVITVYPQAKPEVVMEEVTNKVESALSGLKGLERVVSTASEGSTFTFAMFEYGTDMEKTNRLIEENLAALEFPAVVRDLPLSMPQLGKNPQVFAININLIPVVMLSLSGDLTPDELEQIAVADIMPVLEDIKGVYHVTVEGGSNQQMLIDLDPGKINEAGLSLSAVAASLTGRVFESVEQVENTTLGTTGIRLGEIGAVKIGLPSGSSVSRVNGKTSVSISIMKEAEANTVSVASAVKDALEEVRPGLPDGVSLSTVLDQSVFIERSIGDLARNALIGCLLAIAIVFLFLMAFRASLVTAVSIPLSIILGFFIIRFFGVTINLLTLSAMAIAVGRVIDNSIVVLEVIYRRMQYGEPFRTAAIDGVKEVAAPITSSTLATVVIFIPLIFVGGIVGELFVPFALTMTAALVASLLVALLVIPPLSNFKVRQKAVNDVRQNWYQRLYMKSLKWSLSHRALTVMIALFLCAGSFGLMPIIGTSFMPPMGEKMLTIEVAVPDSTDMMDILDATSKTERILMQHPHVKTVQTTAGASNSIGGGFGSMAGNSKAAASMMVLLASGADLEQTAGQLRRDLDAGIPGVDITVTTNQAMASAMTGSGIDISIRGDRYVDVAVTAQELYAGLGDIEGIANLELELAATEPKLDIIPDTSRIMVSGLSMEQITGLSQEFYFMRLGGTVAQAVLDQHTYSVYINGIVPKLDDAETARALRVGFPVSVHLGDIAAVALTEQPTHIKRVNGKLSAGITATITARDIGSVNRAVQSKIDAINLPSGVTISQGGTTQMMRESFSDMYIAIIIAIVLAFAVIAITFRSLLTPIVIMISLPLASIGALLSLLIAGQTLGISAMMGVLMLVGIVMTNAVVLIDLVERLRRNGMNTRDALLESGRTRMRPILMTALTTIIAMLPLALGLGEGTVLSAELAIVVIGGLFSSTLLTLLVIPVIYSLFKREGRQKAKAG